MRFFLFLLMTLLAAPAHSQAMRQAAESLLGDRPAADTPSFLLRQHYALAKDGSRRH